MHGIKVCFSFIIVSLFVTMMLFAGPASAGYSNQEKNIDKAGGLLIASAALPGGVTSRLKKIGAELDKAEKALAKGAGSDADRAKRASMYLKNAKKYRDEIDRRYAGKFSKDQAEVKTVDERLALVEAKITAQGETPAAAQAPQASKAGDDQGKLPAAVDNRLKKFHREIERAEAVLAKGFADQARYKFEEAKQYLKEIETRYAKAAPDDHPEMRRARDRADQVENKIAAAEGKAAEKKAEAAKARADKDKALETAQKWVDKFKPYVRGAQDELFNVYGTEEAELWRDWKNKYDQIKPAWDEYLKAALSEKSMELSGIEQELGRQIARFEELYPQWEKKQKDKAALMGRILFSKSPLNPSNPQNTIRDFKAGDTIYCLIQTQKTWKDIYGKDINVRIDVLVDGQKKHAQFIRINNPEDQNKKNLLFEIIPAPDKMTAYKNPDFTYGTSKADLRQGPQEMAFNLSQLGPGRHTVKFTVPYYGQDYAAGEFDIEGNDFKMYGDLLKKYQQASAAAVVLPKARMKNTGLEKEMRTLLKDAGWKDIHRLNIVDKDWWINRISGGDSPVKSRHLDAAVLSRDGRGYFYKTVRFEQPRLISGNWGKLHLATAGERHAIPKENIDK